MNALAKQTTVTASMLNAQTRTVLSLVHVILVTQEMESLARVSPAGKHYASYVG